MARQTTTAVIAARPMIVRLPLQLMEEATNGLLCCRLSSRPAPVGSPPDRSWSGSKTDLGRSWSMVSESVGHPESAESLRISGPWLVADFALQPLRTPHTPVVKTSPAAAPAQARRGDRRSRSGTCALARRQDVWAWPEMRHLPAPSVRPVVSGHPDSPLRGHCLDTSNGRSG